MKNIHFNNIGINAYPGHELAGCINDVDIRSKALKNTYPRSIINEHRLIDGEATNPAIMDLVSRTLIEATDMYVLAFSGHGTAIPGIDSNGQSIQRSAIVTVETSKETLIPLVNIVNLCKAAQAEKPNLDILILCDSCHSGTPDRAVSFFDNGPAEVLDRYISFDFDDFDLRDFGFDDEPNLVEGKIKVLSACEIDETAADLRNVPSVGPCGAFTYAVCRYLLSGKDTSPIAMEPEVLKLIAEVSPHSQHPVIHAPNLELPLFPKEVAA